MDLKVIPRRAKTVGKLLGMSAVVFRSARVVIFVARRQMVNRGGCHTQMLNNDEVTHGLISWLGEALLWLSW